MYIMNAVLGHYCVTGTLISFFHYVPSFWICSFCRKHNPVLSSFIMTYHHITWVHPRFVMEILVLACNILQKIVLFFWLFIFFSLCHCVVCLPIYGFWLFLWYLPTVLYSEYIVMAESSVHDTPSVW